MALATSVLAQTAVNRLKTHVADPIVAANEAAQQIRAAIVSKGLAGEFSAQELTALQSFATALSDLSSDPVVTAAVNRYRPNHRDQPELLED